MAVVDERAGLEEDRDMQNNISINSLIEKLNQSIINLK
jgi:hypothetical protein